MNTFESRINEDIPSLVVFVHANSHEKDEIDSLADGLRAKYADRINLMHVDASIDHRLKRLCNVNVYPTWILFKKGEELMRESGKKTLTDLEKMVDRAL